MAKILLRFPENLVGKPITAEIILEHKVPINIITANITSKGGEFLAEIPDATMDKVVKAFRKKGLIVTLPKLIEIDKEECFSCGACITICPVEALAFGDDFSLVFTKEKCLGSTCSACVDACPAKAINSIG
jgi:Na+-translocating ferredoxin:NAD+ oxidoreductase RNF subunit RnfB